MRPARRATTLLALTALAVGCTGGQSGTETPAPRAGQGGEVMTAGAGTGGETAPREGGRGGTSGDKRNEAGSAAINGINSERVCACALAGRSALLRATLREDDGCRLRARVDEVLAVPAGLAIAIAAGDEVDARRAPRSCSEGPAVAPGDTVLLAYAPPATGGEGEALIASWGDELVFSSGVLGDKIALPRAEHRALLGQTTCTRVFAGQQAASLDAPCD